MAKMKGFKKLTNVAEALQIALKECSKVRIGTEMVSAECVLGRMLAEDVIAQHDVPPYDRAAVDGYAIRSEEAFSASQSNPAIFRIVGVAEAGGGRKRVGPGEAAEIYTGAVMPEGADAVSMAEDCEREGDEVRVLRAVAKYANVSRCGEDIKKGEVVFRKGHVLKAWDIGVLLSIRMREVAVKARPKVAVISTGSELVEISDPRALDETSLVDSTRPMIKALLAKAGCDVVDGGIVHDEIEAIRDRISNLAAQADLIITIGGTSVGGKDLVPDAVGGVQGSRLIFHGIAAKPGKPLGFGIFMGRPLFMLPGYPVSALVGYECIIKPVIASLTGTPAKEREKVKARLTRRVPTTPGVRHFLRVVLEREGEWIKAKPIALTGSGLLSSVAKADGLVIVGEDKEGLEEGEVVEVELLGD
uniref:Molybdopterin molybdenumtransferase MoeA n=1 Tax=Candidatus Methanosuratincola petrocarbonis (ex Vanwonterghem et al. 2016) TaxID=1867261 RepID=A0A7J3UY74_9CREN